MKQRGFLLAGPALLYGAIGAGVLILGLAVALKVQSAHLDAAQAHLEACEIRYKDVLGKIEHQNEAVKGLEKAGQDARRLATEAQASATAANKGLAQERDRLAKAAQTPPVGPCPAGEGVREIRKGLK
jgi:hypothetical protein